MKKTLALLSLVAMIGVAALPTTAKADTTIIFVSGKTPSHYVNRNVYPSYQQHRPHHHNHWQQAYRPQRPMPARVVYQPPAPTWRTTAITRPTPRIITERDSVYGRYNMVSYR